MARIEIMPMSEADVAVVDMVEQQIYEFPWSANNFRDSIRAGYLAYCMWEDGSLLGYTVMMKVIDEVHLLNLSVRGDYQGQGFGRKLLRWCMSHALNQGMEGMMLEVRPSNEVGRALYDSEGFKLIGVRKNYYPAVEGREDAMVLFKKLT